MDPLFIGQIVVAAISSTALVLTGVKITLPEKVVWIIGLGTIAADAILNSLYAYGGRYVILFPALFWIKAVQQTTGALALGVAGYSLLNKQQISAHWYSLPTGCSPLAMISQYVPSQYIQAGLLSIFILHTLYNSQKKTIMGNSGTAHLLILASALLVLHGVIEEIVKLPQMGLIKFGLIGASCLLYLRASGADPTKKKLA